MRRALLWFVVASCGRFGFGDQPQISDGKHADGTGDGSTIDAAPQPFSPYWKSGTRMRARLLAVGDGGDPIFYGWRDTVTNTDCQSAIAGDGVERCMPNHARTDQYFADSSCTVPLAWTHGLCGHDSYGYSMTGLQYHAFPLTTPFAGQVYGINGGSCNTFATPATGQLWNLGAEEPPTTFVQTDYFKRTVGTYEHILYDWGDGSEYDLGVLNFNQGSCAPTGGVSSGTTGCKPSTDPELVPVYADSACTQRAFYDPTGSTTISEFITTDTTLCGVPVSVFQATGQVTTATYRTLDVAGCHMQAVGAGTLWAATSIDPYPHGSISPSVRRGRIGHLQWTTSDNVSIPIAEWDHDLGRSCRPFVAMDGIVRCLPRAPKLVNAASDPSCVLPLPAAGSCYGNDPVDGVTYGSCDDGPWDVQTYAPAGPVYAAKEATCTALGDAYDTSSTIGSMPAAMFAPLTESIE